MSVTKKAQSAKRTKKGKAIRHRIRRLQQKQHDEVERLIALAAEPVPPGSGCQTYGHGPFKYVKHCNRDLDAMRIFSFRKQAHSRRAFEAAVTADAIAEGRVEELDEILANSVIAE